MFSKIAEMGKIAILFLFLKIMQKESEKMTEMQRKNPMHMLKKHLSIHFLRVFVHLLPSLFDGLITVYYGNTASQKL